MLGNTCFSSFLQRAQNDKTHVMILSINICATELCITESSQPNHSVHFSTPPIWYPFPLQPLTLRCCRRAGAILRDCTAAPCPIVRHCIHFERILAIRRVRGFKQHCHPHDASTPEHRLQIERRANEASRCLFGLAVSHGISSHLCIMYTIVYLHIWICPSKMCPPETHHTLACCEGERVPRTQTRGGFFCAGEAGETSGTSGKRNQ